MLMGSEERAMRMQKGTFRIRRRVKRYEGARDNERGVGKDRGGWKRRGRVDGR